MKEDATLKLLRQLAMTSDFQSICSDRVNCSSVNMDHIAFWRTKRLRLKLNPGALWCHNDDTIMRHAVVGGSRLILTTWGSLTCPQCTGVLVFCPHQNAATVGEIWSRAIGLISIMASRKTELSQELLLCHSRLNRRKYIDVALTYRCWAFGTKFKKWGFGLHFLQPLYIK